MALRIFVVDADSGGRTGPVLVEAGSTVGNYFRNNKAGSNVGNYRVNVNEQPANSDTQLFEGCRLNISPSKLAGAARLAHAAGKAVIA